MIAKEEGAQDAAMERVLTQARQVIVGQVAAFRNPRGACHGAPPPPKDPPRIGVHQAKG